MPMIDLSHTLKTDMQVCPCDRRPRFEQYASIDREGVNVKLFTMGTHTGAHIDAP